MKKNLIFLGIFLVSSNVFATTNLTSKAIDTPINSFYAPNEYTIDQYMYKKGGVVSSVEMGLKHGLNLGFSFDFHNLIGSDPINVREPKLSVRFRAYRGDLHVPAISVGYLGQGYGEKIEGEYETKEKGFFLDFEREMFLSYLIWNFGCNVASFNDDLYGFVNVRYFWLNKLLFMAEYDNIRTTPNARLNVGVRYYIVENLSMGIAVRKLNKTSETAERIFMITYVGKFNFFEGN